MARQKKIVKYVPSTKIPGRKQEWRYLEQDGVKPSDLMRMLKARHEKIKADAEGGGHLPYASLMAVWDRGEANDENFKERISRWAYHGLCEMFWSETDTFRRINEQFMAEFDNREDLQEIYKECTYSCYWVYSLDGSVNIANDPTHPFRTRPETYQMFDSVVRRSGTAIIEKARETPYVEGDLVMLRDTEIDRDSDPMRISRWDPRYLNGQRTPDKSVPRIGTVISVTDTLSQTWRPAKGSKLLKIMWMGVDDAKIVNVEERRVKWHERPTLKNGLKVRQ